VKFTDVVPKLRFIAVHSREGKYHFSSCRRHSHEDTLHRYDPRDRQRLKERSGAAPVLFTSARGNETVALCGNATTIQEVGEPSWGDV
jgi:hypothetical protein